MLTNSKPHNLLLYKCVFAEADFWTTGNAIAMWSTTFLGMGEWVDSGGCISKDYSTGKKNENAFMFEYCGCYFGLAISNLNKHLKIIFRKENIKY